MKGMAFSNIKHAKKRAFLEAIAYKAWTLEQAAEIAGCDRNSHYHWLKKDEEYRRAFELALEMRADRLEDLAYKRAAEIDEPSDTLLIFLLKGAKPHKYKERVAQEITGKDGGELKVVFVPPSDKNGN